jgi:hypothetical protein
MSHGPSVFYDDNTGYLILDELHDSEALEDVYINTATVTCESIKTLPGVLLTGASFPIAMPYVPASKGKYRGKVPDALAGAANEEQVEAHVREIVGVDIANILLLFPFRKRVV